MHELTIDQVKRILKMSYPTAHEFARAHGRQEPDGYRRWLIPADAVMEELRRREAEVGRARGRFEAEMEKRHGR